MTRVRDRLEVVHEPASAAQQRLVLESRDGATDPGAVSTATPTAVFDNAAGSRGACPARRREGVFDGGTAAEGDQQPGRECVTGAGHLASFGVGRGYVPDVVAHGGQRAAGSQRHAREAPP